MALIIVGDHSSKCRARMDDLHVPSYRRFDQSRSACAREPGVSTAVAGATYRSAYTQ
jgi:hypothetical protein